MAHWLRSGRFAGTSIIDCQYHDGVDGVDGGHFAVIMIVILLVKIVVALGTVSITVLIMTTMN